MLLYKNFYLKGALILATIAIVGSLNIDIVMRAPYFPTRGETLIGDSFGVAGGGKGFNQALAAARLNADSYMIGCIVPCYPKKDPPFPGNRKHPWRPYSSSTPNHLQDPESESSYHPPPPPLDSLSLRLSR